MALVRGERGASAVEYSILLSAVVVAIIVAVIFLGQNTKANIDCVNIAWGGTGCP